MAHLLPVIGFLEIKRHALLKVVKIEGLNINIQKWHQSAITPNEKLLS